mmetsp:Transcript_965/g.1100  ORF Transcript_965/g.1100 Transcript_965/m.1100 type:complete len:323 (-) Transcript_965:136-1104(-)
MSLRTRTNSSPRAGRKLNGNAIKARHRARTEMPVDAYKSAQARARRRRLSVRPDISYNASIAYQYGHKRSKSTYNEFDKRTPASRHSLSRCPLRVLIFHTSSQVCLYDKVLSRWPVKYSGKTQKLVQAKVLCKLVWSFCRIALDVSGERGITQALFEDMPVVIAPPSGGEQFQKLGKELRRIRLVAKNLTANGADITCAVFHKYEAGLAPNKDVNSRGNEFMKDILEQFIAVHGKEVSKIKNDLDDIADEHKTAKITEEEVSSKFQTFGNVIRSMKTRHFPPTKAVQSSSPLATAKSAPNKAAMMRASSDPGDDLALAVSTN